MHHIQQLGRVAVQIDHVGRFPRCLSAVVHRHADVSLGQCRCVVGTVATHGHQSPVILLMANARQFFLGRGLGQHVIHTGFGRNGCGGQRVVTGDHHGANPQLAQLGKAFADTGFDHVLEVDRAKQPALGANQ